MKANRPQMILIAVLVCFFAVGMAGLLNFFKYRGNAEGIIRERLLVSGQAIENDIRSSLALGLNFPDIGTLPNTLERERGTDDLILSIDVFDTDGKLLYSTDRLRLTRPIPASWLEAARRHGGTHDWHVKDGSDSAVANVIKNSFGLTIGYVAIRYSNDQLTDATNAVAGQLALYALLVFVVAATLASIALLAAMHRLSRDVDTVENALRSGDASNLPRGVRNGPLGRALRRYVDSVRAAEAEIAIWRGRLMAGGKR